MNACERFRSLVSDLVLGVEMADGPYRSHVNACEDCESWAQSVFWQDRVLAELAGAARIDILLRRVRVAIANSTPAALQLETPPPLRIRRPQRTWPRRAVAAAAVLLLSLGSWLAFRRPSEQLVPPVPVVNRAQTDAIAKDIEPLLPVREELRTPPIHDDAAPPPPPPPPVRESKGTAVKPEDPKTPEVVPSTKFDKAPVARAPDQVAAPPIDLTPRTPDQAVRLALAFLRGKCEGFDTLKAHKDLRSAELVLWTLLHAGVPPYDPDFQRLLKGMLEARLENTYPVALQAMLLEELDRVSYQWRLQQCAQFLVDNQGRAGLWGYGAPSIFVEEIPTPSGSRIAGPVRRPAAQIDPATGKPIPLRRVAVKKKRESAEGGDHSNSMYAALGLRACHDGGVMIPLVTVEAAQKAWREGQVKGEGGWCYGRHESHKAYGSMTSGGVGSLVIYDYMLGRDWRKNRDVQEGLVWLAKNFSVSWNPGTHEHAKTENSGQHLYYYLYALERAAILFGTEQIGKRDWYGEGSKALIGSQRPDGAWVAKEGGNEVWDTCFAVLFLRKATRALPEIATGVRK